MDLNLIHPELSDQPFLLKEFSFPDGQPHLLLPSLDLLPKGEKVRVLTRLNSAADILRLGLAIDVLLENEIELEGIYVSYLMGARMDRRINRGQPNTLGVVGVLLDSVKRDTGCLVQILDLHSNISGFPSIQPKKFFRWALKDFGTRTHLFEDRVVVAPDHGALQRTGELMEACGKGFATLPFASCVKTRDPNTGKLSGFALEAGDVAGKPCLIVDDLCDGGGTFSGVAAVLRAAGATSVSLAVTHGIFSKGLDIEGIDHIYTTDSYQDFAGASRKKFHVYHHALEQEIAP